MGGIVEQPVARTSKIDLFSKAAATCVLLLYAVGFLITSLYCIDFGFSPVNPFRARVASAGAWFGILVLAPMFVGRLVMRRHIAMRVEAKPWQQWSVFAFSLYLASYSAAFLLSPAFQIRERLRTSVIPFGVAIGVTVLVAGPIHKWLKKRTLSVVILLLTLVILLHINLFRALTPGRGFTVDALVLWVFIVAIAAVTDLYDFPAKVGWHTDWYATVGMALLLLTVLPSHGYPSMRASWGGGETLPVTLYLNGNAPIMPSQRWHVQLVEESDNGYYVVNKGEQKAVFIPRSAVALVYFSDAQPSFDKPPGEGQPK
jgi:hypothetical protein